MTRRHRAGASIGVWLVVMVAGGALAQAPDTTLREYDLAEVVVREATGGVRTASVQRLAVAELARLAPTTAADVVRLVPGAHLQTNSRGEALVYLRGASERQIALFLDGVPLNVPWDARFDLSFMPAALIGGIEVVKGPFSVLYGPNAAGGALDVRTKSLGVPGRLVEAEVAGGWPRRARASLVVHRRGRRALLDVGVSGLTYSGDALPRHAEVPFSQDQDALRTNTDRRQGGALVRVGRELGAGAQVGVAVLYLEGRKGIAPESHLDPTEESVRYWRYPQVRMATVTTTAERAWANSLVRMQLWTQAYAQHIDQYTSVRYSQREATQRDGDYTTGGRVSARHQWQGTALRLSLLGYTSLHRQIDSEAGAVGMLQRYRQHTGSLGVEALQRLGAAWEWRGGVAVDGFATPLTGDKPRREPLGDWSAATGVTWHPAGSVALHGGVSKKTRFPTMRELFGTALSRFLINPSLLPETVWAAEVGSAWQATSARLDLTAFAHRTEDAIDQRSVVVDGRSLRQRVNLEGSRVLGLEVLGLWRPAAPLRFEGHLTVLRARGRAGGRSVPLAEKPALVAFASAEVRATRHLRLALDVTRIAGAYAVERAGEFPRLPGAWVWSAKATQQVPVRGASVQAFFRLDNAFDAVVLPQEGLPAPGRTVLFGLTLQRGRVR